MSKCLLGYVETIQLILGVTDKQNYAADDIGKRIFFSGGKKTEKQTLGRIVFIIFQDGHTFIAVFRAKSQKRRGTNVSHVKIKTFHLGDIEEYFPDGV